MSDTVFVGMSGGVDSSLTALLCKEAGYDVVGVFMKNWAQDLPGFDCPWQDDYRDAKRVAVQLKIPFMMVDFQDQYRQKVVDYLLDGYKAGLTPNPDIMCNQEIKFKLFLDVARSKGADKIAMGHYARSQPLTMASTQPAKLTKLGHSLRTASSDSAVLNRSVSSHTSLRASNLHRISSMSEAENEQSKFGLFAGVDKTKDQSYFLYRITEEALKRTLFPIGDMEKSTVRKRAAEAGLITADKKDSVGICFVGKVGIKPFLEQFVETEPGPIVDRHGQEIGQHDGAIFYTIGQRRGLGVGGGKPYYVTDKDMDSNTIYVSSKLDDDDLWSERIELSSVHWINGPPTAGSDYRVRVRHLGELAVVTPQQSDDGWQLQLQQPMRALSPGQSAVLYEDQRVVGGGIIAG